MGRTGSWHMGSAADKSKEKSRNVWVQCLQTCPDLRAFLVQYRSARKDADRQLTLLRDPPSCALVRSSRRCPLSSGKQRRFQQARLRALARFAELIVSPTLPTISGGNSGTVSGRISGKELAKCCRTRAGGSLGATPGWPEARVLGEGYGRRCRPGSTQHLDHCYTVSRLSDHEVVSQLELLPRQRRTTSR